MDELQRASTHTFRRLTVRLCILKTLNIYTRGYKVPPSLLPNSVRLMYLIISELYTPICRKNQDEHDKVLTNKIRRMHIDHFAYHPTCSVVSDPRFKKWVTHSKHLLLKKELDQEYLWNETRYHQWEMADDYALMTVTMTLIK